MKRATCGHCKQPKDIDSKWDWIGDDLACGDCISLGNCLSCERKLSHFDEINLCLRCDKINSDAYHNETENEREESQDET